MNKIYYIANIVKFKDEPVNIYYDCHNDSYDKIEDTLDAEDSIYLGKYLYYLRANTPSKPIYIKSDDIRKILDSNIPLQVKDTDYNICFEIIEDDNGFKYAKEIYTGLFFPLIEKKDVSLKYTGRLISCEDYGSHLIKYFCSYNLEVLIDEILLNTNIARIGYFVYIHDIQVANKSDIEEYLNKFNSKNLFGKVIENKKLINKFHELADSNVFKSEIVEKKEIVKEREKPSQISSTMESIDYLLLKLSKIDKDLYNEKKKEYDTILNGEGNTLTLSPLTNETLKAFEAELEFIINYNNVKNRDFIDILDNMIAEYYNGVKTERTIEDIDKLCEIFYKMGNKFSYLNQRIITEKLSLLYILEIYENKDEIDISNLQNSYFNDLLKTILINLNTMAENNEIENNIIIRLDDNITPEYILDLIKQIKFVKNNEEIGKQKVITK